METHSPNRIAGETAFAPCLEFTVPHAERTEKLVVAVATGAAGAAIEASADSWLSAQESQRIARAVAKRRREFILGRYAAKTALAVWNGRQALSSFTIANGAFEQPVVLGESAADVTLAHTAEVAIAIAHERAHPIGVDVETVDADRIEVVRTQVAAAELPGARDSRFSEAQQLFLLWSAKEALSKALRCGLTCPFEILAASNATIDETGVCTGTFANFGQYQFVAWLAGSRTLALVCSRNAKVEQAVPSLVTFTRAALAPGR